MECFYPHTMIQPKRARRAPYAKPVWPGYLFARFKFAERGPIVQTSMIIAILGTAHQPEPIPDLEIETVRAVSQSASASLTPCTYAPGETITVTSGPFQGSTGRIIRLKGKLRLVVSIESIQQSMSVEIDAKDCQPIDSNTLHGIASVRALRRLTVNSTSPHFIPPSPTGRDGIVQTVA